MFRKKSGIAHVISFLIAVLCILAIALVAVLAVQSRLHRGDEGADPVPTPPEATAQPLVLQPITPADATPNPVSTTAPIEIEHAPEATEPPFEYLPVISKVETRERMICITVDDCSNILNLKTIADTAASVGAKLTLFPLGSPITKTGMSELMDVMVNQYGFEVENRTNTNQSLYQLDTAQMCMEIWGADVRLDYVLNEDYHMRYLRARGGFGTRDTRVNRYMRQLGYEAFVSWTYAGSNMTNEKLATSLAPGNIYLFSSSTKDLEKLTGFIRYAVWRGYQVVTLNQLLGQSENARTPLAVNPAEMTMPVLQDDAFLPVEMRLGDRSWQVLLIQQRLEALGYLAAGSADGVFGDGTSSAISQFQAVSGLLGTGVASTETQNRLFADDAPVNPNPLPTPIPTPTPTPKPTRRN